MQTDRIDRGRSSPSLSKPVRALDELAYLAGLCATVLLRVLHPSTWRSPVRDVLARQIYFTGVQALAFIAVVAILVGLGIVLQTRLWLHDFGQSNLLGPVLVVVVVRELAPLLVNLIVIVRSGSAIATELANMSVHGEIEALETQGIDPLEYLVVPRVVGVVIATLCLTVCFDTIAFATGYAASLLLELHPPRPLEFVDQVLAPLRRADVIAPILKSTVPPFLFGILCCHTGLAAARTPTAIPQAVTRAMTASVMIVFSVVVLLTALSYS